METRYGGKIKNELRKHPFIRDVVLLSLMIGIIYFGVKGVLILGLQNPSPMMGVEGTSMIHPDNSWSNYYEERGYDPDEFPFQDGLQPNDLVIIKGIGSTQNVEVGDVIVWKDETGRSTIHRVVDVSKGPRGWYFKTKGDHNLIKDPYIIRPDDVLGKAIFSIPYLGYPSRWI